MRHLGRLEVQLVLVARSITHPVFPHDANTCWDSSGAYLAPETSSRTQSLLVQDFPRNRKLKISETPGIEVQCVAHYCSVNRQIDVVQEVLSPF